MKKYQCNICKLVILVKEDDTEDLVIKLGKHMDTKHPTINWKDE